MSASPQFSASFTSTSLRSVSRRVNGIHRRFLPSSDTAVNFVRGPVTVVPIAPARESSSISPVVLRGEMHLPGNKFRPICANSRPGRYLGCCRLRVWSAPNTTVALVYVDAAMPNTSSLPRCYNARQNPISPRGTSEQVSSKRINETDFQTHRQDDKHWHLGGCDHDLFTCDNRLNHRPIADQQKSPRKCHSPVRWRVT